MNTRKAAVEIAWKGAAAAGTLGQYQTSATYTDPASGEADSLDLSLHDRDRQWIGPWLPQAGDTLSAVIRLTDWDRVGDNRSLPCGSFILDKFDFSGWPVTGNISGVSVPADSAFRETQRTRTWENITVEEIGKEIAGRAGISLAWDVDSGPIIIKSEEQSEKTDCDFYMGLCETYGLAMKVYAQKIVVYDREAYKARPPVATLTPDMLLSWSWSSQLTGTYTGGEYAYTDPATEKEVKVQVGSGPRILKKSGRVDSPADAERKLWAAIHQANHGSTKLSLSMRGTASLVASQCVMVAELGRLGGKYFIDSITHHIGGGYTMDLELSRVE